jgi:hypothetical protein
MLRRTFWALFGAMASAFGARPSPVNATHRLEFHYADWYEQWESPGADRLEKLVRCITKGFILPDQFGIRIFTEGRDANGNIMPYVITTAFTKEFLDHSKALAHDVKALRTRRVLPTDPDVVPYLKDIY